MKENSQFTEQKSDEHKEEDTNEGVVENPHEEPEDGDAPEEASPSDSIFDNVESLRKRQDFDALVGTQRLLVSVQVGKPGNQTWFQVLPGDEWQLTAALLKLEEDGTYFYVAPDIYPDLEAEAIRVVLRTVVTTQGTVSLWPIRLPNPDGRDFPWWISARAVAVQAEIAWVRMRANQEAGAYDVIKATDDYGEPDLPQRNFPGLLEVAFAGKVIESLDHPVVLKLLGRPQ